MASLLLKRSILIPKIWNYSPFSTVLGRSLSSSSYVEHKEQSFSSDHEKIVSKSILKLSPLSEDGIGSTSLGEYGIKIVDTDTWRISSGLAEAWKGQKNHLGTHNSTPQADYGNISLAEDDSDLDEIDDMRVGGNLFYKIDRDSKEYEEYSYDFHRRKKSNNSDDIKVKEDNKKKEKEERKETEKKVNLGDIPSNYETGSLGIKKERTLTFNQITAPYHEPFCLDIYVSKGSVRACIVHRATSNVVAVAHSISKDMKFDYLSKRDATTCAAVGGLLAQRALADDIHNVVYTPRKGDRVEGKLQIVLQSIIDNGVHVKVKIKQRKVKRFGRLPTR